MRPTARHSPSSTSWWLKCQEEEPGPTDIRRSSWSLRPRLNGYAGLVDRAAAKTPSVVYTARESEPVAVLHSPLPHKSCVFLLHGANEDHTRGGTAASHTFSKVRVHNAPCVRVTPDTQNHTRKTSTIWARHSGQRLLASRAAHAWHSATWPHGCSRVLMRRSKQTQHSFASSAASPSSSPGAGEGSTTGHKCQVPSKSPSACRIDHSPRTPPLREGCLVYACTSNQGHRAENARHRVNTCKTVECVSSRAGVGMQGPVLCIYGTAARPPAAQPTAKRPPTPQPTAETPAPLPARRSVPPRGTRQRGRGSPTETRAVEWASGLLLSV